MPIARAQEIILQIKALCSSKTKKQMQDKFGICTDLAVGTTVTNLRLLAKKLPKKDQPLADALWATAVHEARILASIVADPAQMDKDRLALWAADLNSWDICDMCCINLFAKTKNPLRLAERFIKKDAPFTRRAGFAILAALSVPRGQTADEELIKRLALIKNHSTDPHPMVYKAVNWALRNIGKKNPHLTPHALACAHDILYLFPQHKTAVWVAKNALYELNSPAIKQMIKNRG